jgi:hypothetical protein
MGAEGHGRAGSAPRRRCAAGLVRSSGVDGWGGAAGTHRCWRDREAGLAGGRPRRRLCVLVAQDQDLCGPPRLPTPGQPQPRGYPRDREEHEPQALDR